MKNADFDQFTYEHLPLVSLLATIIGESNGYVADVQFQSKDTIYLRPHNISKKRLALKYKAKLSTSYNLLQITFEFYF